MVSHYFEAFYAYISILLNFMWAGNVGMESSTLLAEMKSTSNNYPKRTIEARGSSETKKYLGHLWEGPSSKVFVKIFVCLFTY